MQQELILRPAVLMGSGQLTVDLPDLEMPADSVGPLKILAADNPAVSDVARVTLRVTAGPHAGQEFTFAEHNTLFAGRLSSAQLRLEKDLHFSRHHFRLEVNPPTCFLMDLNSRNKTFVNGERVTERFLKHGDIISGGRTELSVTIFEPRPAQPTSASTPVVVAAPVAKLSETSPSAVVGSIPCASGGKQTHPPATPPVATRIAGYQIYEQIGVGDLGTVYRATRMATGESCALKIITPAARADEAAIQVFLREAAILKQLHHPHIVRMIEMGAAGQDLFFATEYVESLSWEQLAEKCSPPQRIRLACGLMSQILGALSYAHSREMVHRDVKPGNILIARNEGKLTAKMSDFGLAKQYTTAGMSQVTRDGDVIGSLPFMSPDQFLNSREARPTCDIYSAGATLYWMLTGSEPIPLDNHPCKFLAILEVAPTPIQQHNPAIPESLATIVHRAIEKTPEKRFKSAAEMRKQLQSVCR